MDKMDRRVWTDVFEYTVAALAAIALALVLAESFTTPLWGGLASLH